MFVVNKSLFKGINPNDKLTESLNILNSVKQLREETKSLAESGPEFDYDYSDREVILVDEDGKKTRIDINDLEDLDLDAVGTKLKMYFETKPENYDPTLVNLVSLVNETKIEGSGPNGKSAYEIAVENGFVGTEEEWLKSLHGKNADDLYQSAVNNGYKGTFDEWIKDLFNKTMIRCNANVVDKQILNGKWTQLDFVFLSGTESLINHSTFVVPSSGLYGISISGSDSFNGLTSGLFFIKYKINGVDSFTQRNISTEGYFPSGTVFRWFEKDDIISVEFFSTVDLTSINKSNDLRIEFALLSNTQGVDGKSAYEIAVENGFMGTEEEWLESLKVPPIPFPVGQNGQSIFNKLTGSQEYSADFICKFFPVASNTEELDKLLKEEFSFEAVFNNWYRFSHGGSYKYPYLPSELNSWIYDSNNKSIKSTINSNSYIGFTSFDKFTKYDIDLTLKSTDADDDVIGFVIAFLKDDTREYTLSVIRSCGGIPPIRNAIIYNYLQPDQKILVDTSLFDNLKNGSNSGIWWSSFSNGTRIKCKREQNIIKVDVSQFNSTEFDPNLSMEFDLSSDPLTTKFMGGASYGFSCFSQNNSYFKINESTNSENVIIDQPNNIVYTYSYANSQWIQASNDFKSTIITEGRFIYSNFNNKFYFVKDGKLVQLMNKLKDLIIAEMKEYIDAKIITMESVETVIDSKLDKFLPEVLNDVDKKIEDFSLTLPDIVTEISNKLIEEAIKNLPAPENGKSAYDIAVEEGFVGTKEEWIASLHGKDAKNFYQSAVEEGYEGTFDEWIKGMFSKTIVRCSGHLKSTVIPANTLVTVTPVYENGQSDLIQGDLFTASVDGLYCLSFGMVYGPNNAQYCASFISSGNKNISCIYVSTLNTFPSLVGIAWLNKGESFSIQFKSSSTQPNITEATFEFALLSAREGKSAYEIAVEEGFIGTKEEWIASLHGKDAKNFYQSAVEEGFTGTFDEWIKSLFKESIVRCSGNVENINVTAFVNAIVGLKADDGDVSLVKDNKVYAPMDGLYIFSIPGMRTSARASGENSIMKYDISGNGLQIARNNLYDDTVFSSLIGIIWLKKGESLSFNIISTGTLSYAPSGSPKFEFALISPQKGDKGEKGDKGDPSIGEPSYYPVGWQQVLGLTDDIVTTENEIWLKCNGQRINKDEYPDLILTNSVVPSINDLGNSLIATMTSNNSPSPQVASASTERLVYSAYKAFDGTISTVVSETGWASEPNYDSTTGLPTSGDGEWLQINMGNIVSFNIFSITLFTTKYVIVNFDLLISDNGMDFTLIKSFQDCEWETQTQMFYLNKNYTAKYIKILIRKVSGVLQAAIGEFKIYNQEIKYNIINIPKVNNQYTYVKAKDINKNTNSNKNIGEIFWWPLDIPPDDSLYCNGAEISRFTYKDLYEIIGTSYGEGNGTDTFNLPDLRGEFIRGYDSDNIRDLEENRNIGTHQDATVIPRVSYYRYGNQTNIYYSVDSNSTIPISVAPKNEDKLGPPGNLGLSTITTVNSSTPATTFSVRPTNMNLLPCIRFKTEKIRIIPGVLSNIEYASNDDLTDNDNIETIANRENGSIGIKRNLQVSFIFKTIKFNTLYNPNTDTLELQTSPDRIHWAELSSMMHTLDNTGVSIGDVTSNTGIGIVTSSNKIQVRYGKYRVGSSPWSTITSNWYWRVVKKTFAKSSVNIINSPHLWEPNKEYIFDDGSCGKRFVGEISVGAGTKHYQKLDSSIKYIIDIGGEYYSGSRYVTVHSNLSECSDTIARNESNEVFFDSYSSYTRTNAKYDIWMKYIKE